jgi:hypothetical protein
LPFARAALYQDGLLAATPSYEFSAARLALNALAGVVAARRPSCYPGRHSTSFAGRNQERSELGRGLQQRTRSGCASGPWVKRPWQDRSSECFSWAWPMWRTVVATSLRSIPNTTLKKNTETFQVERLTQSSAALCSARRTLPCMRPAPPFGRKKKEKLRPHFSALIRGEIKTKLASLCLADSRSPCVCSCFGCTFVALPVQGNPISAALGLVAALGFFGAWASCRVEVMGDPEPPFPLRSPWPLRSVWPFSACVRVGLS